MPHHGNPTPSLNLQIPSLHDSLPLDARIYLPPSYTNPPVSATTPWKRKVAVVAHPYAPLGGCYDEYVVVRVAAALLKTGWVVATFNFRGARGSKGSTSWTGSAEIQDYASVVTWVLAYVQSLPPPCTETEPPTDSVPEEKEKEEETISLLFSGYSYGSLIASNLPSTQHCILPLLTHPPSSHPAFTAAIDGARRCARCWQDNHSSSRTSYSGSRAEATGSAPTSPTSTKDGEHWEDRVKGWKVTSSYLLVSPLLPPVSSFLLGFGVGSWVGWMGGPKKHRNEHRDMGGAVDSGEVLGIEEEGSRVLAVHGVGDAFTSVKKWRRWREKMSVGGERWKGVEIEGAGHFWHGEGVVEELEEVVREWAG